MHINTVMMVKDDGVNDPKQIALNVVNIDAIPPEPSQENYFIDYDTLTVEQKAVFDAAIVLAESFVPIP